MEMSNAANAASRSSLTIERHYVPRTAPRVSRTSTLDSQEDSGPGIPTSRYSPSVKRQLPSPGPSSVNSHSPNGYVADYSVSEVSSLTGSISSMPRRQHLDPSQLPYSSRYIPESGDSGMYSARVRGYPSSVSTYADTDIDSVTGDKESRYKGELFQPNMAPTAAPRISQKDVRQMYGEVHPKNLLPKDLPTPSSGDELETMSDASIPSFADVPRARPRASLRRKKLAQINSGFLSDDDASVSSQLDRSKSLPRGILKNNSTDISDAESLATTSNFKRTLSGRTVRFQHNDKARTIAKKVIDYDKLDREADSADSSSKKKKNKTSSSSDPFSVMKPVGIKPARNDPKRSSSRSSQRGSKQGRQSRSSSRDRSRHGSMNRGQRAGSGRGRSSSVDSKKRSSSAERSKKEPSVSVSGEDVKIDMPESNSKPKSKSLMHDLVQQHSERRAKPRDTQKIIKWALIIGVPTVLVVIVIAVIVAVSLTGGL